MDLWLREYEEAKALASDILAMVQVDRTPKLHRGFSLFCTWQHSNGMCTWSSGCCRAPRNAT